MAFFCLPICGKRSGGTLEDKADIWDEELWKMINFIAISKTFTVKKQQIQALDHVSLQVENGDIFG